MLPQKVQEAKDNGSKVIKITIAEQDYYFRKPSKAELMKFQDNNLKGKLIYFPELLCS